MSRGWLKIVTFPWKVDDFATSSLLSIIIKVVAFCVSRNHVEYASFVWFKPGVAARQLSKVRIKETALHGQELWPRSWIACRFRNSKPLHWDWNMM